MGLDNSKPSVCISATVLAIYTADTLCEKRTTIEKGGDTYVETNSPLRSLCPGFPVHPGIYVVGQLAGCSLGSPDHDHRDMSWLPSLRLGLE